jgi:hypothetical protein
VREVADESEATQRELLRQIRELTMQKEELGARMGTNPHPHPRLALSRPPALTRARRPTSPGKQSEQLAQSTTETRALRAENERLRTELAQSDAAARGGAAGGGGAAGEAAALRFQVRALESSNLPLQLLITTPAAAAAAAVAAAAVAAAAAALTTTIGARARELDGAARGGAVRAQNLTRTLRPALRLALSLSLALALALRSSSRGPDQVRAEDALDLGRGAAVRAAGRHVLKHTPLPEGDTEAAPARVAAAAVTSVLTG